MKTLIIMLVVVIAAIIAVVFYSDHQGQLELAKKARQIEDSLAQQERDKTQNLKASVSGVDERLARNPNNSSSDNKDSTLLETVLMPDSANAIRFVLGLVEASLSHDKQALRALEPVYLKGIANARNRMEFDLCYFASFDSLQALDINANDSTVHFATAFKLGATFTVASISRGGTVIKGVIDYTQSKSICVARLSNERSSVKQLNVLVRTSMGDDSSLVMTVYHQGFEPGPIVDISALDVVKMLEAVKYVVSLQAALNDSLRFDKDIIEDALSAMASKFGVISTSKLGDYNLIPLTFPRTWGQSKYAYPAAEVAEFWYRPQDALRRDTWYALCDSTEYEFIEWLSPLGNELRNDDSNKVVAMARQVCYTGSPMNSYIILLSQEVNRIVRERYGSDSSSTVVADRIIRQIAFGHRGIATFPSKSLLRVECYWSRDSGWYLAKADSP